MTNKVKENEKVCLVCGYDKLCAPPYDQHGRRSFEICPCCGFEFGFDDDSEGLTHTEYKGKWIATGAEWFDTDARPEVWDLDKQLKRMENDTNDER